MNKYNGNYARKQDQKVGKGSRFLNQLLAVSILFALWSGFRYAEPQSAALWEARLDRLMSQTCDLLGACRDLGESLSQGENVAVSVGNWCETVFLPEESTGNA